jgi:hypothetical protein
MDHGVIALKIIRTDARNMELDLTFSNDIRITATWNNRHCRC